MEGCLSLTGKIKLLFAEFWNILFETSFLFLSPSPPLPFFPIKLKSISLMKSKAFKPSLTFMIAIFHWINIILYTFCWRHRLLLFAGESVSNIFKHCFVHNRWLKLETVRTGLLNPHPLSGTEDIMKPDISGFFPWSAPDFRPAQRGAKQRQNGTCP